MAIDPRDVIWDEAQDLLYHVSYAEALIAALLARWVWLDTITKIVVAISSGGAALAGLVFWKNNDYTFLWKSLRKGYWRYVENIVWKQANSCTTCY